MRMQGHGAVTPPEGYLRRLITHPDLSIERTAPAVVSEGLRDLIATTHRDTHQRFRYMDDAPGEDTWTMPVWHRAWQWLSKRWVANWYGDCEDFAILVRRKLIAMDIPPGALRIATCMVTEGGVERGHAVLTIEFADDTMISDVRKRYAYRHDNPVFHEYRWLARQAPERHDWEDLSKTTLADIVKETS